MKARYFQDTDTLYLEFMNAPVVETCELDENTLIDVDARGGICSMTIEHASIRAQAPTFTYECVVP